MYEIIIIVMRFDLAKLERALAVKGWTQKDLAEASGVSGPVVSNLFNDKPVSNPNAKKIVDALELEMEKVLVGSRGKNGDA